MTLKERLQSDLHEAMKARQKGRVSTLRMLRSAIGYAEIERQTELDDSSVMDLVSRQVKQRQESIDMYRQAGRDDLVDKETQELEILKEYLPEQLDDAELRRLASSVIADVGAQSPRDKGAVMKALMPQVKGRAQGGDVNRIVSALLEEIPG